MKLYKLVYPVCAVLLVICIFLLGWYSNALLADIGGINLETPFSDGFFVAKEQFSPSNHINPEQIQVTDNQVILNIPNVMWAEIADTNSMDPLIDKEANTLEIAPEKIEDIQVGDVIVYQTDDFSGQIIHRVIETGYDADGWYCTTKGDNLTQPDPYKIRYNQVVSILVGIIY